MEKKSELALSERAYRMEQIASEYLKGNKSVPNIAKITGLKRQEVMEAIQDWELVAKNDPAFKDRATQALVIAEQQYDMVIQEQWALIERNKGTDDKTVGTNLKNVADVIAKRVEMLQKAGLIDDSAMANEMAEQERKMEILKGILQDISSKCDRCRIPVAQELSKYSRNPEEVIFNE